MHAQPVVTTGISVFDWLISPRPQNAPCEELSGDIFPFFLKCLRVSSFLFFGFLAKKNLYNSTETLAR